MTTRGKPSSYAVRDQILAEFATLKGMREAMTEWEEKLSELKRKGYELSRNLYVGNELCHMLCPTTVSELLKSGRAVANIPCCPGAIIGNRAALEEEAEELRKEWKNNILIQLGEQDGQYVPVTLTVVWT